MTACVILGFIILSSKKTLNLKLEKRTWSIKRGHTQKTLRHISL